ncbi:probable granule-bound starch synthase 1, chloroplastic/amyloplastic [Coccomyxa sp. Obi]|nr:probable granule-bound starch synthase 1, chloroplastic/amyloplastic [Coccomyxa sp. Obi]
MCTSGKAQRLQLIFVTTEVAPWSKVGGLADVMQALPPALASRGHRVMTVAPRYAEYEDAHDTGVTVPVLVPPGRKNIATHPENSNAFSPGTSAAGESLSTADFTGRPLSYGQGVESCSIQGDDLPSGSQHVQQESRNGLAGLHMDAASHNGGQPAACEQHAQFYLCRKADVDHVFVDHPLYCRTTDIYGSSNVNTYQEAGEFPDLDLRYSILCQAALAAPLLLWGQGSQQGPALQGTCLTSAVNLTSAMAMESSPVKQTGDLLPGACLRSPSASSQSMSTCQQTALPLLASEGRVPGACQPQSRQCCPAGSADEGWQSSAEDRGASHGSAGGGCGAAGVEPGPLIFIGNDWPCAPLALRLKHCIQQVPASASRCDLMAGDAAFVSHLVSSLQHARAAFCIHNLAYQGSMPVGAFARLCLPDAALPALLWPPPASRTSCGEDATTPEQAQSNRRDAACSDAQTDELPAESVNWMHAALSEYDSICTVSPNYAREICTDVGMACGMRDLLRSRGVSGIMNGLDTVEWDPAADEWLPAAARFHGVENAARGKAEAKRELQMRTGLAIDPKAPLLACVGRLTGQKGMDVLLSSLPALLNSPPRPLAEPGVHSAAEAGGEGGLQVVLLGTGEGWMERALAALSAAFPGRAAGVPRFDELLAHLLMAAADYVIVPSRFEPCGLVAQSAARYGAIPIVTAVGGLRDFVTPEIGYQIPPFGHEDIGQAQRAAVASLVEVVNAAVAQYGSDQHKEMQKQCLSLDLSWAKAAQEWEQALVRLVS